MDRTIPDDLIKTLTKYLSHHLLFPAQNHRLPAELQFVSLLQAHLKVGHLSIDSDFVIHPGPTLGYRISNQVSSLTYILIEIKWVPIYRQI